MQDKLIFHYILVKPKKFILKLLSIFLKENEGTQFIKMLKCVFETLSEN